MIHYIHHFIHERAHQIGVQAFDAMSDSKRLTLLLMEERSASIAIFQNVLIELAETLVSGSDGYLLDSATKYAVQRAEVGIPLHYGLERMRLMRDHLLDACRAAIKEIDVPLEDRLTYQQIEIRIYQYLDMYMKHYAEAYEERVSAMRADRADFTSGTTMQLLETAEKEIVDMVFNSTDIGLLLVDQELAIRDANDALADMFLVEKEHIITRHVELIMGQRPEQQYFHWAVRQGTPGHYVADYHGRWITFTIRPIRLGQQMWGAIAVFRNVTQSKQFEEELSKRDALAAVGQLAAGIAHEIRNPLTSVKGFIQLIRERGSVDETGAYFSVIQTEIERMEGLLNDVLVLARFRHDSHMPEHFQLAEEACGVVRLLEPEANRRGIAIYCELLAADSTVYGLKQRIRQVLLNLCKNALEAVSDNGTKVAVCVLEKDGHVVVTVEDDGPGLPPEVQSSLFTPFFTTKQDGTGLGLLTTKRIVEDHQGHIAADQSPLLGGACFTVSFPASRFKSNGQNVADS
ncbi:GHKL domain-containing protein [Brevibacillus fluminis]|uniref:histidine kinase n=1 Tax=Brevibacillus fluminis TaxID=511487 RepID=A0A3M8DWI9_9BACL|nr:ATP-binding protein [Brevibacillus fluminis]RNB91661.1 GHKL domain-containing protein [Brevibacillus fluminis]